MTRCCHIIEILTIYHLKCLIAVRNILLLFYGFQFQDRDETNLKSTFLKNVEFVLSNILREKKTDKFYRQFVKKNTKSFLGNFLFLSSFLNSIFIPSVRRRVFLKSAINGLSEKWYIYYTDFAQTIISFFCIYCWNMEQFSPVFWWARRFYLLYVIHTLRVCYYIGFCVVLCNFFKWKNHFIFNNQKCKFINHISRLALLKLRFKVNDIYHALAIWGLQ